MKTTGQKEKKIAKIPIEILLDVCKMIHTGDLMNRILGSNEALGEVLLEVTYEKENSIQKAAFKNIEESIATWKELRYGEEDPDEITLS